MSSHHFVREGQEPDLLVISLNDELVVTLDQLLGWCPLLVASGASFPQLAMRGYKVDEVWGDTEDEDFQNWVRQQWPIQVRDSKDDSWKTVLKKFVQGRGRPLDVIVSTEVVSFEELTLVAETLNSGVVVNFHCEKGRLFEISSVLERFLSEGTLIQNLRGEPFQVSRKGKELKFIENRLIVDHDGVFEIRVQNGTTWFLESNEPVR